jgi:hypothetical protein
MQHGDVFCTFGFVEKCYQKCIIWHDNTFCIFGFANFLFLYVVKTPFLCKTNRFLMSQIKEYKLDLNVVISDKTTCVTLMVSPEKYKYVHRSLKSGRNLAPLTLELRSSSALLQQRTPVATPLVID